MNKTQELVLKAWKDPVWSKVISVALIGLVSVLWATYVGYSFAQIVELLIYGLSFRLPIYVLLSFVGLYLLCLQAIKFIKRKPKSLWNEQVGHYTFKELTDVMRSQTLPIRTHGMSFSGQEAPDDNLVILFLNYTIQLNAGITIDYPGMQSDGGFGFAVLCPKLMSFGLVDCSEVPDGLYPDIINTTYRMSELGRKFLSLIERIEIQAKANESKT